MHSKNKGNIGQLAVAKVLAQMGYSVFTEQGDISKIDLIAEKNGKLIRFQCKAISPRNGAIAIRFEKFGPNYKFKYESFMFDYFGVYDLLNDKVYVIPSTIISENPSGISLRIAPAKNNQSSLIRYCNDYLPEAIIP